MLIYETNLSINKLIVEPLARPQLTQTLVGYLVHLVLDEWFVG